MSIQKKKAESGNKNNSDGWSLSLSHQKPATITYPNLFHSIVMKI